MKQSNPRSSTLRLGTLALALSLASGLAFAQDVFDQPAPGFDGSVRATESVVLPGSKIGIEGGDFVPGQKITLLRGDTVLNAQPYVVDAEGGFKGELDIPANAVAGTHPVVVRADGPDAASIFELKISKEIPQSGADRFDTSQSRLVRGLYQVDYSPKNNVAFVASAVGRPPVKQSELLKIDADSLEIIARATPAPAPAPAPRPGQPPREGGLYAVYGVGVDDANGNVWVTNTRQDTVAVYKQSDLSLVKQYPVGAVPHSRDVQVDGQRGRVYVSATGADYIAVFDAKTLEQLPSIEISSSKRGEDFVPASIDLDVAGGKLYTTGLRTGEVAVVDLASGKVDNVFALPNARSAIGVAFNPVAKRVLVVSQGSDNLLIVDPATGKVEHDVYVGAGALNVSYNQPQRLAYVSNRGAGTVTVVNDDGEIVANLDGGTYPNHVANGPDGVMFAINKSRGEDDAEGDRITRIVKKK